MPIAASSAKRSISIISSTAVTITAPTMDFNINNSNVSGWGPAYQNPNYHNSGMLYASGQQDTAGRMVEYGTGQHLKPAGQGQAGRYAQFTENGAPTFGLFADYEGDTSFGGQGDNWPSFYLPQASHGGWVTAWNEHIYGLDGTKILNGSGALYPQLNNDSTNMGAVFKIEKNSSTGTNYATLNSNYNPATIINPTGNWTCFFGGGYYFSNRDGVFPTMKVIIPNPDYPGDSRPYVLREVMYPLQAPAYNRYAVLIGDYIYWGGGAQGTTNTTETWKDDDNWKFWRIYAPSLLNNNPPQVVQEACPNMPYSGVGRPQGYFSTVVADVPRRRVIHLDLFGISVLQIPANHAVSGMQWFGPFYPSDQATWETASTSSTDGSWQGYRAVHRTEFGPFGQTFFMPNISNRMCRLRWTS